MVGRTAFFERFWNGGTEYNLMETVMQSANTSFFRYLEPERNSFGPLTNHCHPVKHCASRFSDNRLPWTSSFSRPHYSWLLREPQKSVSASTILSSFGREPDESRNDIQETEDSTIKRKRNKWKQIEVVPAFRRFIIYTLPRAHHKCYSRVR